MRYKINIYFLFVLVFYLLIFCAHSSFAITQSGATIEGYSEIFHEGGAATSEVTYTEVAQIYGVTMTPTNSAGTVETNATYYFPHYIENRGNGTDKFTFTLDNITPEGWSAELIVDDNMNSVHEETETTTVPAFVYRAEEATYYFFLALTASSLEGQGSARVTVTTEVDDGPGFYGANGIFYGDDDLVSATDTATASISAAALSGLHIARDDSSGNITLTWEGGAADVYYIETTFEAAFYNTPEASSASIEAGNVTSPWTSSAISAQDGVTRYYRVTTTGSSSEGFAPETVGKFDAAVSVGLTMMSLPLIPNSSDLTEVIGTQVTGASNAFSADRVWKYNPAVQGEYDIAWLVGGVGPPYDGQWYTGNNPTTMSIEADEGFFLQIRAGHSATYITFVGQVSDTDRSINLAVGLNMVGTCFPITVALGDQGSDDSNLWESGATGANNSFSADRIWTYNVAVQGEYDIAWLVDNVSPTYNGLWYTGNNPTTMTLEPGKGYYIQIRSGHSGFTWDYNKLY